MRLGGDKLRYDKRAHETPHDDRNSRIRARATSLGWSVQNERVGRLMNHAAQVMT